MTVTSLYYDPFDNYFVNDDGRIVYDIFKYIPVESLATFKELPGYYYIYPTHNADEIYEIYIPFDEDLEEITNDEW